MRRNFATDIEEIQKTVKKINSLVKLPRLNDKQSSLNKLQKKETFVSELTNEQQKQRITNIKKMLSKKLLPLNKDSIVKPKSSLVFKPINTLSKQNINTNRISSSKNLPEPLELFIDRRKSFSYKNLNIGRLFSGIQQIAPNQIIDSVQKCFLNFLSQKIVYKLVLPIFYTVKIEEFHPYWEVIDTMILTFSKMYFSKPQILKQIILVYTCISAEIYQIRRLILQNVQKIGKKQLQSTILQSFLLQTLFVYCILGRMIWKQDSGVLEQFLFGKIESIIKLRKTLLQVFLCDLSKKQETKVNNKVTKFILIKQKLIMQLIKLNQKISNELYKALSQLDFKFMSLNIEKVQDLQDLQRQQEKLKRKLLGIPSKPFINISINKEKYNIVVQPQSFLYQQDKKQSTIVLRENSVNFLKEITKYYNVIIFSRKGLNQLKSYLNFAQNQGLKFDAILDKKYLTYYRLKLQKNLENLAVQNMLDKTIVIDTNYKQLLRKQYWHFCLPINKDGNWEDETYLSRLSQKLVNIVQKKQQVQMPLSRFEQQIKNY